MRPHSYPTVLAMLISLLLLISCGSVSDSGALYAGGGIGGTGITVGEVSAFGSVVVNEVAFSTDEAVISVNGNPASESDLRIGMIVNVMGQFDAYGQTGTADSIAYEKDLQGPVTGIVDIDDQHKELTVLGQTVVIHSTRTHFDEPDITFDNLADKLTIGTVVEVSGFFDSNAVLWATWVQVAENPDDLTVRGIIGQLDEDEETFMINALVIDYSVAELPDGGLQQDWFVSVTGREIGPSGELIAESVALVEVQPQASEGDRAEIAGFITTVMPSTEFMVEFELERRQAAATNQTVFVNGSPDDVQPDRRVEVEGRINAAGLLVADRVIFQADYTEDTATAVAAGPGGSIYVTGYSKGQSTDFDYVIVRYDPNGNANLFARYDNAGMEDKAQGIAVDRKS